MTHARWCLLLPLCLSACERGDRSTVTPTRDDEQLAGKVDSPPAGGEGVPIVAVPQRPISTLVSAWGFDLDGRRVAEQFEDGDTGQGGCGIWDIESGTLLSGQLYTDEEDDGAFDPCIDWQQHGSVPAEISADGKLHADVAGGLVIETYGVGRRSVPGCVSCGGAAVWAPSGHQLATCNGNMLEVWDADTGTRLRSETLGLGKVEETRMGWTHEGIGVLALHEITGPCEELEPEGGYCNWAVEEGETEEGEIEELSGYALSSFWWPADGGAPVVKLGQHKSVEYPDFYTDVGMRWFAFSKDIHYDRDGSATTLYVFGLGDRSSGLGWTETHDNDYGEAIEPQGGFWRADAVTQWIEGVTVSTGEFGWYDSVQVGWTAIVAEPNPAVFRGQLGAVEGEGAYGEVEVLGAAGGVAAAMWSACNDGDDEESCNSGGPSIRDCDLLDISPSLSLALVECETGLRLLDAGRGTTVSTLPHDPASEFRWGRGNYLALLEPSGKLGVVELSSGKTLYERTDVGELLAVPLAPEQDRLALRYADHLEIVAGATGERIIDVPGEWIAAALSPDGEQLATLGDQQIRVLELASGATIATAAVEDHYGLAWRQDGAALFYGYDWPTHALDPKTGKLLYELSDPILDVLDLDEIDPSWRWIHRPDGSVVRTLDFERLELGPTWARVGSGAFEGELGDLPANLRFRVGDDPDAPAIYTVEQLEPWLRTSGLVSTFFAGKPLPSPRVPADALARLDKREREG